MFKCSLTALHCCIIIWMTQVGSEIYKRKLACLEGNRVVFLCLPLIHIWVVKKNGLTDQLYPLPVTVLDPICTSSLPSHQKIPCYFCCNSAEKNGTSQPPYTKWELISICCFYFVLATWNTHTIWLYNLQICGRDLEACLKTCHFLCILKLSSMFLQSTHPCSWNDNWVLLL